MKGFAGPPGKTHSASLYVGHFWMGGVFAVVGYLASELGYQLNFWEAPGVWGAPGRSSTVWGLLRYILPPLGFAVGVALNAALEHRMRRGTRAVRIGITVVAVLLLVVTLVLGIRHGMQTLG